MEPRAIAFKGSVVGDVVHRNPMYPRGRRCQSDDCVTFLSVYNSGPLCWKHRGEDYGSCLDRSFPVETCAVSHRQRKRR
jgi:hypothetical protein